MLIEMLIAGSGLSGAMLALSKKHQVTGFYLTLLACLLGLGFFLFIHLNYLALMCIGGLAMSVVNISKRY